MKSPKHRKIMLLRDFFLFYFVLFLEPAQFMKLFVNFPAHADTKANISALMICLLYLCRDSQFLSTHHVPFVLTAGMGCR